MSPQVNILVIAPYRFLPVVNGGHKAIEQLYRNLGSLIKTIVVSTESNDESLAVNYRLVKLFDDGVLHYLNPFYLSRLKRLIAEERITHVITDHPYMGWLGMLLRKQTGVRFIIRSHNIEAMRFKTIGKAWWKAMWQYEKTMLRAADMNFFITEEDKNWAVKNYKLNDDKGSVITFGIARTTTPAPEEKSGAKEKIQQQYQIPSSHRILLFNGDLSYAPNEEAVRIILTDILPRLQKINTSCTIFICGRGLKEEYVQRILNSNGSVIYTGYVEDINLYLLATDVFINPVISGGGIKTKLVEAIGFDCNAVSFFSGATGIPIDMIRDKLRVVPDNDRKMFTEAIINTDTGLHTGACFYDHFYWGNIARKALHVLEDM